MTPVKSPFTQVRKRDGRIVPWDQGRITHAVYRAMEATQEGDLKKDPQRVSDRVVKELSKKYSRDHIPHIEEIQDVVEETLILMDFPKVAKSYILYRSERAHVREARQTIPENIKNLVAESKKYFRNALAEFIYYRTDSRWIDDEGRRETWVETVDRYMAFMRDNIGENLREEEYREIREAILWRKVAPSMRLIWSAGKAAHKTNVTAYNCSYVAPSKIKDFAEIMYLLMCGTGVGYSVESQTVQQLPIIKRQTGKSLPNYVIPDSKEGWGDALTFGLKIWYGGKDVKFDYSELRPAGARLHTMGGRSSGPEPLRALLDFTRAKILSRQGKRLGNLDVHDVVCKIGEVVVMGGVRRSALISLSDLDDEEMRHAKEGQFYLFEPQRQMANNSAVYNQKPAAAEFMEEWLALAKSRTGERGIFNRGGLEKQLPARRWKVFEKDWQTSGVNPCVTGDTLVYVADGRGMIPIRQLAEEGRDTPVFSRTKRGGITVRYMRNPRLTGRKKSVYEVVLDDGSKIKATANHKFLLTSGVYKEVKDLKYGDSLSTLTRFAASIKDVFNDANSRSQDYWWVNNGRGRNVGEHRLIAEFHYNTGIPQRYVVHHRDRNAQNNAPQNLEILSKEDHDAVHGDLMGGDNNPMRRAQKEWGRDKWNEYRRRLSDAVAGSKNGRFSGITNDELKNHALVLTKIFGRRFSQRDWVNYARKYHLPQHLSKWRRDHLGGVLGLAKWAAAESGVEHFDIDPRVANSYKKYTSQGYDCEIEDGRVVLLKRCEVCHREFRTTFFAREYGVCSIACGLRRKWQDAEFRTAAVDKINKAHQRRKSEIRIKQSKIYSDLKFKLKREPSKLEWVYACKVNDLSAEIARRSSPFRTYDELKEFASSYNHKVISVDFAGYEDVYNGTVDEFHNFFVGGFESSTRNGKKKFVYLNNLQCGEIYLKSKQFCNLTEVICRADDTEETLLEKVRIATIMGTYQSTLTHFPYLSKEWKKNCEEERLLGVSLSGQWDSPAVRNAETLKKLKEKSIEVNREYAKRFGINASTAITCVKPSGTNAERVDCSPGMHPRHAKYYIRRVRISATDPLFHMLKDQKFPYQAEVGQLESSASTYVLEFPVKAPEGAVIKSDLNALDQLEYWKMVKESYTEHNPSVTVSVADDEWIKTSNWLYDNWDILGGLSFLPRADHAYMLAPYEEITEEKYNELAAALPEIDFSQIVAYEKDDHTHGARELACVSGVCEVEEIATGANPSS